MYVYYRLFEWYDPNLGIDDWSPALKWPSSDSPYQSNLRSTSRHQSFRAATKEESTGKSVNLKCGKSWCRFRIQCYKLRETKKKGGGGGGGGRVRRQPPPLPKDNERGDSEFPRGQGGGRGEGGGGGGEGGKGERRKGSGGGLQPSTEEGKGYRKKDVNVSVEVAIEMEERGGGGETVGQAAEQRSVEPPHSETWEGEGEGTSATGKEAAEQNDIEHIDREGEGEGVVEGTGREEAADDTEPLVVLKSDHNNIVTFQSTKKL